MNLLKLFINLFHFNRTNWKALALCLLTASIFWLFNALNKNYSTNLQFPLRFEYDQERFAPVEPLPLSIQINVNGNGWDLFRKYFGIKVPVLRVPLERPAETKKIAASTLSSVLIPQLGGVQINYITQDTFRLQLENRVSRKFKLVTDLSLLTYRNDLGRISPVVVLPDSVELNGPFSMLSTLTDSIVLKLSERKIGGDFREEVEVDIPYQEFIKRNPPVVEVRFEAGEMVNLERFVKLKTEKLPWGFVVARDSFVCSFRVPRKSLDRFRAIPITGIIELDDLQKGKTKTYLPKVTGLPAFVEINYVDSVKVKRY